MPTQLLSRADVSARFGLPLPGFEAGPPDHPTVANQPPGMVTENTEQAAMVSRLLVAGVGHVRPADLGSQPEDWEKGRGGDANRAVLRLAPLGVAMDGSEPGRLVERVVEVCSITHTAGLVLSGAAAIAAAVSAGIAGRTPEEGVRRAMVAAQLAADQGDWVAGAEVAWRIGWATELVSGRSEPDAMELIARAVGTGATTQEAVPAAFAVLAAVPDDPWRACRQAASLGGCTDTIAAMVGAIGGARHGAGGFPGPAVATIAIKGFDLDGLASDLLALRARGGR